MILRDKDKNAIIALAKKNIFNSYELWAFGSRINGDAHDTSDLDLVIVSQNKQKIDIDNLMSFKNDIRKSNIPIIIQILDWNRIPDSFHKNILANYEVLK